MMRLHVDVVLAVRDGFTGATIAGSALLCRVDGQRVRPVMKDEGYLVFCGLSHGEHEIVISAAYFQDERVRVACYGGCTELVVTMKPAANYPFGNAVTWLSLGISKKGAPAPGARLWAAALTPLGEIKIAQDAVGAGEDECRLFCRGSAGRFNLPGNFLLIDGEDSELCRLEALSGESGSFFAPLAKSHKRGRGLYPAQCHTADGEGKIRAVFREPVELALYSPDGGRLETLTLASGENEAEYRL